MPFSLSPSLAALAVLLVALPGSHEQGLSLSGLPACGVSCLTKNLQQAGSCGLNIGCLCKSQPFLKAVAGCYQSSCDLEEAHAGLQWGQETCSKAGAALAPLPGAGVPPASPGGVTPHAPLSHARPGPPPSTTAHPASPPTDAISGPPPSIKKGAPSPHLNQTAPDFPPNVTSGSTNPPPPTPDVAPTNGTTGSDRGQSGNSSDAAHSYAGRLGSVTLASLVTVLVLAP